MERRYEVIDAAECELVDPPFDGVGRTSGRAGLERVIEAAVRLAAPSGTVTPISDYRIEATK